MQHKNPLNFCNVTSCIPLWRLPVSEHKIEITLSKQNRYKTELCRSFEESNTCDYGKYCRFAHTRLELKRVTQHPKYKTKKCTKYHMHGYCAYGVRCRFIH